MNEDMKNIRCKACGMPTIMVDDDFFFDGNHISYFKCTEKLCGAFTRVMK